MNSNTVTAFMKEVIVHVPGPPTLAGGNSRVSPPPCPAFQTTGLLERPEQLLKSDLVKCFGASWLVVNAIGAAGPVRLGDGAYGKGRLVLSGDSLCGTASGGGSRGAGTVFAINTDGTGFTLFAISKSSYWRDGSRLSHRATTQHKL